MSEAAKLYEARVNRIKTTANHQEPDRVPVIANTLTWSIAYAGSTVQECIDDTDKQVEVYSKKFNDIYWDGTLFEGLIVPMKTLGILGSKTYFVSSDGVTIQHHENTPMLEEEYPELIEDPLKFLINKFFPRKFPVLNKSYPDNLASLKEAAVALADFVQARQKVTGAVQKEHGVVAIAGAKAYPPFDVIFDRLRGFKGVSLDMRRCPDKLTAACEALFPMYMQLAASAIAGDFPYAICTLHAPTFLGPKNFERFFWPTFKRMLLNIHEMGSKTILFMEGNWTPLYDYLNELPKSSAIALLEADDVFEAKKRIGDKLTIMGAVPTSLLKYGTKAECLDFAKKLIDECAPGGGFMLSIEQALLSKGDVNIENLKAVNQFVHEYGVYK